MKEPRLRKQRPFMGTSSVNNVNDGEFRRHSRMYYIRHSFQITPYKLFSINRKREKEV